MQCIEHFFLIELKFTDIYYYLSECSVEHFFSLEAARRIEYLCYFNEHISMSSKEEYIMALLEKIEEL